MAAPTWFLSFDPATVTFAFSLSRIDVAGCVAAVPDLRASIAAARAALAARDAAAAAAAVAAADAATRGLIVLADGAVADLSGGVADDDIPMVRRLQAVARYVEERVRPAVRRALESHLGETLQVVVEYQMGANDKTRAVAAALVTLFAAEDVIIVGPSLKNRVAIGEDGRYCYFAQRYAKAYSANKAHARHNFARFEAAFGSQIPPTPTAALRGHIADSFLQVVGHLAFGRKSGAELMF